MTGEVLQGKCDCPFCSLYITGHNKFMLFCLVPSYSEIDHKTCHSVVSVSHSSVAHVRLFSVLQLAVSHFDVICDLNRHTAKRNLVVNYNTMILADSFKSL